MLSKPLFCVLALGSLAYLVNAAPLLGFEDETVEDTAIVESTVREVRAVKAAASEPVHAHYHKKYDSGDKGNIGYTRQKADKGKTGYQKFDSFHKKGGDNYGFEKHDSFGHEEKKNTGDHDGGAGSGHHDEGESKKVDHQSAPDDSSTYEVIEDSDGDEDDGEEGDGEESDDGENVSESEAGIADSGYDEDDAANYDNPTEYTYGSGNEYDFK